MEINKKFVTSINCMDGRTQEPIIKYMKSTYHADYADMVTEPGPNKILADNTNLAAIESIKTRVSVSLDKHNSKVISIVGHYDCGGNPSPENEQKEQIKAAVELVKGWKEDIEVIGLWVDENWTVYRVI